MEKDLYFYKKTSRDLKKKLKELLVRRQLATMEIYDAGDGAGNPDAAAGMLPAEEFRCASRTENTRFSGRDRQTDSSTSSLRTQATPPQLWEDGPDVPPVCSSLAPPGGQSNEDRAEIDENQFSKSHSRSCSQIQPVENVGQLHGVTPVKLCRKELRQISALELSLRRSSLVAGVGSMTADSIEVSRKPSDLKTVGT